MLLQLEEPNKPTEKPIDIPIAIGIDLGTTQSLAAYKKGDEAVRIITDILPSIVSYADNHAVLGTDAIQDLEHYPEKVILSIKRLMGKGFEDLNGTVNEKLYPISNVDDTYLTLDINGKKHSPIEISADILKEIKKQSEEYLEEKVTQAVITVPAYFDDAARVATKDAARLAGLDVLRLVNEPTAAALAYGLDTGSEGLYGIFDLGGGTFDFSVLNLQKGVFQVIASNGNAHLGGDDFDQKILEHFNIDITKQALQIARKAKENLSIRDTVCFAINNKTHTLSRQVFNTIASPLVKKTLHVCQETISYANIDLKHLNGIVMVGGSTRISLVRQEVELFFKQVPLTNIDPDQTVALGAALQAHALTHGSDTLLMDITPLSLGIEIMGGMVERVIERNSPVPISKSTEFTTYKDGQTGLFFHILQGEREMVDQCRSLAKFKLTNIPPMVAGAARIKVTFQVDGDGLLTVRAKEETTGVSQHIEVKPSYGLNDTDMRKMIMASLENAKEDVTKRLLAQTKLDANRFLESLIPALTKDRSLLNNDEYNIILNNIEALDLVLKISERDEIDAALKALEESTQIFAERRMTKDIKKALEGKSINTVKKAL